MRALVFVFLLCFSVSISAQNRPKVGLALSGGGAKCMTQLGALRAIEEAGIKIDYISGTSMGAIIGAMYAMGYTVDEIGATLAEVDWDQLMSNNMPRNRLPYLHRNDEKYLLNIDLDDGKLILPKAFNQGNYMLKILSYLTMRHHDITDFSDLNIPFLCMATDLETGESVVFDSGNLTDALRASAAYPSIFAPYEIDGRLYVDGGIRNNLPIAVLKDEKQMDIVIAVDVQGQLYVKDELNGIVQVLEQVGSIPNMLYYDEQKEKADLIISPPVSKYAIDDYEYADTLVKMGYASTKAATSQLVEIATKQGNIGSSRKGGTSTPLDQFKVDSIAITGVPKKEQKIVRGRLALKDTGTYSLKKLDRGLDLLYGSNVYEKAEFQYITYGDKKTAEIKLKRNPSRHSFKFGLHYDDDFSIALLANYTMRDAGLLNSLFIAEIAVSENPRGQIAYLYERGFFPAFGIRGSFNRFEPRIYSNLEPIGQFNLFTYNIDAFFQTTLFRNYTIGTGFKWDNVQLSETIPILGIEETTNRYLFYHAFLDFDSFDRSFRPTKGFVLSGTFNIIWPTNENIVEESSSVIDLRFNQAISFTKKWGLETGLTGAATIGGDLDYQYNIFVGGLGQNYINFTYPFVGYRFMELIGRNFVSVHAWMYYEFYNNHFLTLKGNIGSLEPTVDALFNSSVILDGYGLSYAYKSPIGPLELTVMGSTNHARIYTYISLGFWF